MQIKISNLLKIVLPIFMLLFFYPLHTVQAAPLAENKVFKLTAQITDPNTLVLNWNIEPENFLYKERFSFSLNKHQHLGPIRYPTTDVEKKYPQKIYKVYRNQLKIPLAILSDKAGTYRLDVYHQGCADSGFCYPPTKNTFDINVNNKYEMVSVNKTPKIFTHRNTQNKKAAPFKPHTSPYETLFESHNIFFIILSFYGFGLLLAFTPCVLPMVPVLSGIIVGQHKNISSRRALFLSISYVLGMSLTYAAVGVVIAALGQNLQTLFQSPFIIGLFSLLFIVLALSMFDFYSLSLPQSWQAKLAKRSNKQNNGAYIGAASMGALSTLILSPCVTAPLVGALTYIAKTSNMLLGGFSLLFLGFGMGTPLIIIGASAGKLLPKVGNWMNHIKHTFGIVLLVIAISLAERIAPPALTMTCWSTLLIICGLFLSVLNKQLNNNRQIFACGISILFFIYGGLILIGVALGNTSPYQPLNTTHKAPLQSQPSKITSAITVNNLKGASQILQKARQNHQKVLIDFYADWCTSCKEMEQNVFNDPSFQTAMKDTILLKVNVTERNQASEHLEKNFNVVAPPTLILLDKEGEENSRIIGETDKQEVIKALN